ncbi:MAG: hypothetical protein PUD22_02655 [Erysipelotrichaceae bacterium]|nr:hypothetical protein [Erysipelotrichaceae bacterium]
MYDKTRFSNNVKHLLKEQGIKSTDLDASIGKSSGYTYKTLSDASSTAPSIEVVSAMADKLHTTVTTLLEANFDSLTKMEHYILSFVTKLIKKTTDGSLAWKAEQNTSPDTQQFYCDPLGGEDKPENPLFVTLPCNPYDESCRIQCRYYSRFITNANYIPSGNFFYAGISYGKQVYITKLTEEGASPSNDAIYELYLISGEQVDTICSSALGYHLVFRKTLQELYGLICEAMLHFRLEPDAKKAIDSFMED